MISFAGGLALMNKKIFCYAMAPFIVQDVANKLNANICNGLKNKFNSCGCWHWLCRCYPLFHRRHLYNEGFSKYNYLYTFLMIFHLALLLTRLLKNHFNYLRLDRDLCHHYMKKQI